MRSVVPFLLALLLACGAPQAARAQERAARVSILYTGRGLGALGVRRAPGDHQLLTEQAAAEGIPFSLVSHPAWRAPGIVVFVAGRAPGGEELADAIRRRGEAEVLEAGTMLASGSSLMLQDPWRPSPNLVALLERNPRRSEFGDLTPTRVRTSRLPLPDGDHLYIVEQAGAYWPDDPRAWTIGEVNRVDVGPARLFELPFNLGGLGPRAAILRDERVEATTRTVTVDLGTLDGDVGLPRAERARIDFTALREMGYEISVPFEFELALGAEELGRLHAEFPGITLLAANVRATDSLLFAARTSVRAGGVRLGFVGLVDPAVRDRLPRAVLGGFRFEDPVAAARREVEALRQEGVTSIVVLSNLEPALNARVAQEVTGIDAIVADLPARAAPERMRLRVELPDRPFVRSGTPAVVARGAANGVGVGRLDLEFRARGDVAAPFLAVVEHRLRPIADLTVPDTALVRRVTAMAAVVQRPPGAVLVPPFLELVAARPELAAVDAVTRGGRISQGLWESFMARRVRLQAQAEVSVLRRLEQFQPLIGAIPEQALGGWLWTEDRLVVLDLPGADLKALLRADARGELVASGVDLAANTILGHRIEDAALYRVATTDVLFEGARSGAFARALRVRRDFVADAQSGRLVATSLGGPIGVRDFVLDELRRTQATGRPEGHAARLAALLAPGARTVDLTTVRFERPTIWASLNQVEGNDGYVGVPESRVLARDAWVVGASGRFVVSRERQRFGTDLGMQFAFAQQRVTDAGVREVVETADDFRVDLTQRLARRAESGRRMLPFIRALYDTEFSATRDPATGAANPKQRSGRLVAGLLLQPGAALRSGDVGLVLENDFSRTNVQHGLQARADLERPLGALGPIGTGRMTYRLRNDLTYFLPTPRDTRADLGLRYWMVHEVVVPLVDELSLSVAADLFFFRGKVAETRRLGTSSLLRVGLTYDRLWKPRYQPFF